MNTDSKFLNITIIFFVFICLIVFIHCFVLTKAFCFISFLILLLPILSFFVLKFISSKYKWKNITTIIFGIFISICNLFYIILVEIIFLFLNTGYLSPFSLSPRLIEKAKYEKEVDMLIYKAGGEKVSHFPLKLPENHTDYYFQIEDAFDGNNTHYVKFSTTKDYIDKEKKYYKNQCQIITTKEKIDGLDLNIYSSEIKNADNICILHKSTLQELYTSGISVYNDTNTIYYFYADF